MGEAERVGVIALCTDLRKREPLWSRAYSGLSEGLKAEVKWIPGPCHAGAEGQGGEAEAAISWARGRPLVLGVCELGSDPAGLQLRLLRAGLDPTGVQVVALGRLRGERGMARARLRLKAAMAKAMASTGARPENLRPVLLSSNAPVTRRRLFTFPPITYRIVPTVDAGLCHVAEGCDRCVSECPHGAISQEADRIVIDTAACRSCGACVSACPWRAVEFPSWSPHEVEAELSALFDEASPVPVAFVCSRQPTPSDEWIPIRVPCAGALPIAALLWPLALGAPAVGLLGCLDECAHQLGEPVQARVQFCRAFLQAMGDSADRIVVMAEPCASPPTLETDSLRGEFRGRIPVFGREAPSQAIMALARSRGARETVLRHPAAPGGDIRVLSEACTLCGTCATACPSDALAYEEAGDAVTLSYDAALCIGCGACVGVCPEREAGAIEFVPGVDIGTLAAGRRVLTETTVARCIRFGGPIGSVKLLDRVADILGEEFDAGRIRRLCIQCRGF